MTDREKAFVLNGLRNFGRAFNELAGIDPDDADRRLAAAAKALNIPTALLEEARVEQQTFVEQVIRLTLRSWQHGA